MWCASAWSGSISIAARYAASASATRPVRAKDDAEVVVGVRVVRVEGDRPLVRRDRLVQPEAILQHDPEVAVPVGPIGLELEAPRDQRDGVVVQLLLMREHTGEVQRAGMVGRDLEDASVDLRSRRPLLGLLQRDRDRQRLVDAQRSVVNGRFRRPTYPSLFALRSYLKWRPASSEPLGFCGRYSRSTFANARVTDSI